MNSLLQNSRFQQKPGGNLFFRHTQRAYAGENEQLPSKTLFQRSFVHLAQHTEGSQFVVLYFFVFSALFINLLFAQYSYFPSKTWYSLLIALLSLYRSFAIECYHPS
jgi:hypothetical protein